MVWLGDLDKVCATDAVSIACWSYLVVRGKFADQAVLSQRPQALEALDHRPIQTEPDKPTCCPRRRRQRLRERSQPRTEPLFAP